MKAGNWTRDRERLGLLIGFREQFRQLQNLTCVQMGSPPECKSARTDRGGQIWEGQTVMHGEGRNAEKPVHLQV